MRPLALELDVPTAAESAGRGLSRLSGRLRVGSILNYTGGGRRMSSQGAEALAAWQLIQATIRALKDRGVLSAEDTGQIYNMAIEECDRAGATLHRNIEASKLMARIRDADLDR